MCGRFALDATTDELIREYVTAGGDLRDWTPQYSIAPTNTVPVVREREHGGTVERDLEAAVWDFTPAWMDVSKKKRPQINARLETVNTLGLWKTAFRKHRCVVPMRGYFEWTGEPGSKQPHFIHHPGHLLSAAGIYAPRKDDDGAWYLTVSIITREARDASGEVHDRMPVFLTPDVLDEWLAPVELDENSQTYTLGMLEQVSGAEAAHMVTYLVDKRVSNQRVIDPTDPHLLDPI